MTRGENIARVESRIKEGELYPNFDSFLDDAKDYLKRPITGLDQLNDRELQTIADLLDALSLKPAVPIPAKPDTRSL
jgi:hypothetical protein